MIRMDQQLDRHRMIRFENTYGDILRRNYEPPFGHLVNPQAIPANMPAIEITSQRQRARY
jgi:hypothetical protein